MGGGGSHYGGWVGEVATMVSGWGKYLLWGVGGGGIHYGECVGEV